jgi:glycosyltransferase involved in cell wall biosynthesis
MRVLHVDGGRHWGGGQNQVRLLMRGLDDHGIAQLCICPAGSPLESRLRREGLPTLGVIWRSGSDPRAFAAIARTIGDWDVVHCHDAHAFQLAIAPARLKRVPIVAARRVCFRTRALKWNLASRIIAISDAVCRNLVDSGVREERIRKIYSGIDIEEVAALERSGPALRERIGVAPDEFLAGNVGTLLEFKNQTLIPRAAARADGTIWVIIGEGPRRGAIERAIAEHGVADRVRLSGALPDARRYLSELDVFVFTSKGEALGTSILDAMARDIPVVAADDAGPAEVLQPVHERTGASLYPGQDADALAAAVQRVRARPDLAREMIDRQRERLHDFRIERTIEETLAVYEELVPA